MRVAGFATAIRRSLLPVVAALRPTHPRCAPRIHEHEPVEAFALLADDDVDLALTYDYNLAPALPTRCSEPAALDACRGASAFRGRRRPATPRDLRAVPRTAAGS